MCVHSIESFSIRRRHIGILGITYMVQIKARKEAGLRIKRNLDEHSSELSLI
jgi:hypothetical protein